MQFVKSKYDIDNAVKLLLQGKIVRIGTKSRILNKSLYVDIFNTLMRELEKYDIKCIESAEEVYNCCVCEPEVNSNGTVSGLYVLRINRGVILRNILERYEGDIYNVYALNTAIPEYSEYGTMYVTEDHEGIWHRFDLFDVKNAAEKLASMVCNIDIDDADTIINTFGKTKALREFIYIQGYIASMTANIVAKAFDIQEDKVVTVKSIIAKTIAEHFDDFNSKLGFNEKEYLNSLRYYNLLNPRGIEFGIAYLSMLGERNLENEDGYKKSAKLSKMILQRFDNILDSLELWLKEYVSRQCFIC